MHTRINIAENKVWGNNQLICFSGVNGHTPWRDGLVAMQTMEGAPGVRVSLPEEFEITFPAGAVRNIRFAGDAFSLEIDGQTIRGVFPDAYHLLLEGGVSSGDCGSKLKTEQRAGRLLVGVSAHFDSALLDTVDLSALLEERMAALDALPAPQGLDPEGGAAYRKALMIMRSQVYSPEGCIQHRWTTPERWPHQDMWLWDSVFHALGWRHIDPSMARDAISAVFDCQREDGFIPHRMTPMGEASEFTQPPLLAYAVWSLHEKNPSPEWVRGLYPKLKAYLKWDMENRDQDGDGLLEWHIEELEDCRSGESGADNSPRFDPAKPFDAVDFNAFLANDLACLSRLASIAGFEEEARQWHEHAEGYHARINRILWDEEAGFYFDYDPEQGQFHRVWSSSGFMPLFSGTASREQAARMVQHLNDGGVFDTELPLASVAPSDRTYVKDMWRGPSWLNHSWMAAEGLSRYGYEKEAQRIRTRWMEVIEREHDSYGTLFEYYDCEDEEAPVGLLRKGKNLRYFPHQPIHYYGWTATLYVDLCNRFREL
ncbi:trehalase family glycosidase [Kiritimatiellaeota bacterium B1221]|nr:trehalase family glycosidase [Kiritimatiellaeota bacterium B1221]